MVHRRLFLLAASFLLLTTAVFAQVGNIEGIVQLPAHGGPAAGATVVLYGPHPGDSLLATTDDQGAFHFDSVAVGPYRATATLAPYLPAMGGVFVRPGHTAHVNLVLRAVPTGIGRVEGVVLLPEHAGPAVGATVVLFRARGDSLTTVSDDSGRFVFDSARVGRHDIYAMLTGYRNAHGEVFVRDGLTSRVMLMLHTIPVPTFGNIAGTVIYAADSLPASGVMVTLFRMRHDSLTATTDAAGHFAFDSIATGGYTLRVVATGYLPIMREVGVRNGQTTHVTLVLRAEPTAVVEGLVTLADATPVAHAFVTLGGQGMHRFMRTMSDSLGHFAFQHVAAGHYVIAAEARNQGHTRQALDVADGQTVDVTLVLNDSTGGAQNSPADPNAADDPNALPVKQFMANNYPNPFNPTTTISFSVPLSGQVRLAVYDVLGRKVADLVNEYKDAGSYHVSFNGENLPSGLYFYRMNAGNLAHTGRMMLLK